MSKNEEKERKISKGQKKDNKLTKGNKNPGNDNKSPLKEGGKPDDISNAFPNFSALTEDERLAFFQALTAARKNVEKRGILTRQRFGTVHDQYLEYFDQDEEEGKKSSANAKETPSLKSSLTIHDGNASSCSDQSTLKLYNRNPSDGGPRLPTPLFEGAAETPCKGSFQITKKEKGSWQQCDSVINQNTTQMVDIYLRKKKRIETKSGGVQLVNRKLEKNIKKEIPDLHKKSNFETGKKRKESSRMSTAAKMIPKVRNTPKFDALSTEEKDIFFRTLQEAHDSVVKKNPEKKLGILPLNAILKEYQGDREATSVFTTAQELRRGEEGRKNLRVKVTLTSGDNERLSRTKSQVFSDGIRETRDRRHKSAESLLAEGKRKTNTSERGFGGLEGQSESFLSRDKLRSHQEVVVKRDFKFPSNENKLSGAQQRKEPNGKNEIQSESSFWNSEKANKPSLESCESEVSILNKEKETKIKTTEPEKKEKKCKGSTKPQVKKNIKTVEKQENLSPPVPSSVILEPKITDSLKVNISTSSLIDEKSPSVKSLKKEGSALGKKGTKNEKQKKKTVRKIEESKEENKLNAGSFFPCNVTERRGPKPCSAKKKPTVAPSETKAEEECEIVEKRQTPEKSDGDNGVTKINPPFDIGESSEKICEEDSLDSEKEEQQLECDPKLKGQKIEKEIKMDAEVEEEKEASTRQEMNCEALEGFLTETAHSISNLSSIAESLEEMSFPVDCEEVRAELQAKKQERLIEANRKLRRVKEVAVEANAQGEIVKGSLPKEEKTVETAMEFASGKVMLVDDNMIEKIKKLICYLEAKTQKDGHLEKEYLQLVVDYVDYLSKVLESLVLKEERKHKQVHDTYTAAEVHLKFDDGSARGEIKQKPESKSEFFPRSISDQDFKKKRAIEKAKEGNSNEKSSNEKSDPETPLQPDSASSSDFEAEARFTPIYSDDKKILQTKIRLLQDLLKQRAEFVEGSIADFKIVHHAEAEDLVPVDEKPPRVQVLTDEDEENVQQDNKKKFFKILLRCCACGKKKTDEDGIFENLKGEAVRVEMYEEKKIDPASATLNQSTMEVLKATERKKIIEKYYKQD